VNSKEKADEIIGSFTGFDEVAIENFFGKDFARLNATMTMRSMAFIQFRREEGMTDPDAFKRCMQMPLREVRDYLGADLEPENGEDKSDDSGN
jgi:hypothetical protein